MEVLDHSLGHYLVELHRPASGWQALQQLSAQARAAAELLNAEGTPVRFLRSIFVPEKDSCFFLYEGVSADAVGEAGRRAALAIGRIALAVRVENFESDLAGIEAEQTMQQRSARVFQGSGNRATSMVLAWDPNDRVDLLEEASQ